MVLPCGKCGYCRERKLNEWTVRVLCECRVQPFGFHFVTLTYSEKFLTLDSWGNPILNPNDLTLFLKRLRYFNAQNPDGGKIKYVASGEYGSRTKRPHFHLIIFGCYQADIVNAWRDVETNEHLGNIRFGTVTPQSVRYTLKYILKESLGESIENRDGLFNPDEWIPPFRRFSKGIGKAWVTDHQKRWHKADLVNRIYVPINDLKYPMPRYYKDLIYSAQEKAFLFDYWANKETDGLDFETIQIINAWKEVCRTRQAKKSKSSL